jgi:hypothetical protein
MSATRKAIFLVPLLWILAAAQQGPIIPLSINIHAAQTEFTVGEPIVLDVTLENTSTEPIRVIYSNSPNGDAELTYKVEVLKVDGSHAPRTKYGRALRGENEGGGAFNSFTKRIVKPQEQIVDRIALTKVYNFAQPGEYTVILEKEYNNTIVTSNAIKIKVHD